jgi:hypothetical protein
MTRILSLWWIAIATFTVFTLPADLNKAIARPPWCTGSVGGTTSAHGLTGTATQQCDGATNTPKVSDGSLVYSARKAKTLNCGPKVYGPHAAWSSDPFCRQVQAACAVPATNAMASDPTSTTLAFLHQDPGGPWVLDGMNCDAVAATAPPATVTPFLAYAQVTKLVPSPAIGAAPGKGTTLVNMQTIFWVNTAADRSLGLVNLLGHRVGLRIHAESVAWDFGDGQHDDNGVLGRPYQAANGCATAQCRGYYGHTYTTTGSVTVAATVTWTGQFSVDGGVWQDVINPTNGTNTVTGPAATTPVRVMQARGVLVPPGIPQ